MVSNISASLFLRTFKHLDEKLALLFRSGLFGRGSGVEGEQLAPHSSVTGKGSIFFRRRILRRLVCLAIMADLLIWPSPWVTLKPILDPVSVLASTLDSTAGSIALTIGSAVRELRSSPVLLIPSGPIVIPVPMFPIWPFSLGSVPQVRMADRIERVSTITVSPHSMVAYVGETVTFVAMGSDIRGEIVHGAKFTWESSDTNKLTIDEAGRAATLRPGMVIVTARAGGAVKTAPVLIRPTRRPVQTDSEWRADQESLVSSTAGESGVGGVLASLAEKLAPTAYAQGGGQGADYPNATWPGDVGTRRQHGSDHLHEQQHRDGERSGE